MYSTDTKVPPDRCSSSTSSIASGMTVTVSSASSTSSLSPPAAPVPASQPPASMAKVPDTTCRNTNRRSNKPIMEKRRRARINNCLNELKALLLEAMKKDPARHSKLEKADILELTVSHLKELHRSTKNGTCGTEPISVEELNSKYRAGFLQCISEVESFINSAATNANNNSNTTLDSQVSCRLLTHLADCLNNANANSTTTISPINPVIVNKLTYESSSISQGQEINNNISGPVSTSNFIDGQLHHQQQTPAMISLVPSRLPTGELAFIVPGFNNNNSSSACNLMIQSEDIQYLSKVKPEIPLEVIVSSSSNTNTPFTQSNFNIRHYRSSSSSPSSSLSSSSLSPVAHNSSYHQRYQPQPQQQHYQQQQQQQPGCLPPPAHFQSGSTSYKPSYHSYYSQYPSEGQPLALVKVKNEFADEQMATDLSCWRPW